MRVTRTLCHPAPAREEERSDGENGDQLGPSRTRPSSSRGKQHICLSDDTHCFRVGFSGAPSNLI